VASSQLKVSQDSLREEMLGNMRKTNTDSTHKITADFRRSLDPVVRDISDFKTKLTQMSELKSSIDYIVRQLEKTATKDNMDSFMNYVKENYTLRKETHHLATVLENKAGLDAFQKLESRSLEMDKLVVDVE
jgi:hypothetical protein